MTYKFISCAAIAATLTLTNFAAGQAFAAPLGDDAITARVDLRDLDLQNEIGLQRAMSRIQSAAVNVCGGRPDLRRLDDVQAYNACHNAALSGAAERLKVLAVSGQKNATYAIAVR